MYPINEIYFQFYQYGQYNLYDETKKNKKSADTVDNIWKKEKETTYIWRLHVLIVINFYVLRYIAGERSLARATKKSLEP